MCYDFPETWKINDFANNTTGNPRRPSLNSLCKSRGIRPKPGSRLSRQLRQRGVLTISVVAVLETVVVGHIAFSPVEIAAEKSSFAALTLAPIAVLPTHQNKGIGSKLVTAGLEECGRLAHEIIILVGHPNYYPRFGFVPACAKGIECEFEVPDEAWMIAELKQGALAGRQGKVRFQPEFREAM